MNFNNQHKSIKCHKNRIELYKFLIDSLPIENEILVPNIIHNISDIKEILKSPKKDKFKYIYLNKKNINQLLYNADAIFNIDDTYIDLFKKYENLFYLDYLISNSEEMINYSFSKKFLIEISTLKIVIKPDKIFILLLKSKIVCNLINNFKGSEFYDETNDEKELNLIMENCKKIIKQNIDIFNEIGVDMTEDKFNSLSVVQIYIEVLNTVIKSPKNFENDEYFNKIANYLQLEKIYITKSIFEEINKTLMHKEHNEEKDIAHSYIIEKTEDLFDVKKINFYYFMIKYVYKNYFYFFQVELLLNARNVIIHILKKELYLFFYFKSNYEIKKENSELINRVDYVIMSLTSDEYYFNNRLKSLLFFHKSIFSESLDESIELVENYVKVKRIEKYEALLKNKEIINKFEKIGIRLIIICDLFNNKVNVGDFFNDEKKLKIYCAKWKIIEGLIKEKKSHRLGRDIKIDLCSIFQDKDKTYIVQKIFKKNEIDIFVAENKELLKMNKSQSKVVAKVVDSIDFHYNSDKFGTSSILIQSYSIPQNSKLNSDGNSIFISQSKNNFSRLIKDDDNIYKDFLQKENSKFAKSNKYLIIEYVGIIARHDGAAEFFIQLSNGKYISGGNDKIIFLYEKSFVKCKNIDIKEPQYNLYEVKSENIENKKDDEINLISFSKNKIYFCTLNTDKKELKINGKFKNSSLISVYYLDEKYSLIVGLEKIARFDNKWNNKFTNIKPLLNLYLYCRGGKLLNFELSQIFVFTSNEIIPNGENKMIFYDHFDNRVITDITGYSFLPSYNNLLELKPYANRKMSLLLVACQKKEKNKLPKNGVLLVTVNLESKFDYSHDFIGTDSFEVSCFCQILLVDNNNSIYDDITKKDGINITETNYILIGGFDEDKREGCIKLYKVLPDKKYKDSFLLKYKQDIDIDQNDEFNGFDGKISCITQSTITGNILVTCWDGTVHMFKPPNLDAFKNEDDQ